MQIYIWVIILLFLLINVYFKIAERFKIIDKPNERSSHVIPTIRGGGIVFFFAIVLSCVYTEIQFPYFLLATVIICVISLLDDIYDISWKLRFSIQLLVVLLLLYQIGFFNNNVNILVIVAIIIFTIGVLNAYNFMDGINGMNGLYSLSILIPMYFNYKLFIVDKVYFEFLIISILIFGIYNFRKKARCFSGDIGSMGISIFICFNLLYLFNQQNNISVVLLLLLYGIDSILTIVQRIYNKENVFKAHRMHLYQLLCNEMKIPHLTVSMMYFIIQIAFNFLYFTYIMNSSNRMIYLVFIISVTSIFYLFLKNKLLTIK